MRLRNVKNKEEILNKSKIFITNPEEYIGKWNKVFNNDNEIHIEIGMGKGSFIIEMARRYPNINFIGIEKYDSVIVRALEKIDYLDNLRIVRMDASLINYSFYNEVSRIYLNFSDPWPKKRHALRRLTSPVFLEKYDSIFLGDGVIYQKTDNRSLFEYSLISLSEYGYVLKELSLDLYKLEDLSFNVPTEYEIKFNSKGQPIYRVVAVKENNN